MSRRGVSSRSAATAATSIGGPSTRPPPSQHQPQQPTPTPAPPKQQQQQRSTVVAASRVAARGPGVGGGGGSQARVHDPSGRISEFWAPDDKCPQCKTDRLIAPKLRLLVSPCYHKMCESCVDRIFSLGSAPCPQCGATCRKNQFGVQTFSDLGVEREVDVRRRVGKIYNKQDRDFPSMEAYNDYLEEVEEITFNLINNVDPTRTEARIAMHEHANRTQITRTSHSLTLASSHLASSEQNQRVWRQRRAELLRQREEEDAEEARGEERELLELDEGQGGGEGWREKWAGRRREKEERRRREDEVAERERLAMLGSTSTSSSLKNGKKANGATGTGKDGIDIPSNLYRPFQPEMLLDFEGPLARLDDARTLFLIPPPPARLLLSSEGGGGDDERGYVDVWNEQPRLELDAAKVRAGGYDWAEVVRRRVRSGLEGMWIAPVGGEDTLQTAGKS